MINLKIYLEYLIMDIKQKKILRGSSKCFNNDKNVET